MKPVLLYYVHHHGNGHKATYARLEPELAKHFDVVVLTHDTSFASTVINNGKKAETLPSKWPKRLLNKPIERRFNEAFEGTPYAMEAAQRSHTLSAILLRHKPTALFCDGSVELAIMARSMGLHVVSVKLPGKTHIDPTHIFAFDVAEHLIAFYPESLEDRGFGFHPKTHHAGFLSQYRSNTRLSVAHDNVITIIVGSDPFDEKVLQRMCADPRRLFHIIGNEKTYDLPSWCEQIGRVDDISLHIKGSIVISAAGLNTVSELCALQKRMILVPLERPYDEQYVTADNMTRKRYAIAASINHTEAEWIDAIDKADDLRSNTLPKLVNDNAATEVALKMKEWYANV